MEQSKIFIFSKTSTDIYFGNNISSEEDSIVRAAYALGSLNGANGLDRRTLCYNPGFPKLQDVLDFATKEVKKINNGVSRWESNPLTSAP